MAFKVLGSVVSASLQYDFRSIYHHFTWQDVLSSESFTLHLISLCPCWLLSSVNFLFHEGSWSVCMYDHWKCILHMCPQSHFLFFLQLCLCVSPICLADSSLLAPICQGGSSRSCLVTSKIWTLREPHKSKWILVIPKHNCLWAISSLFDSTFISFNVPRLHKSHLVDNSGSTFYFKLFFTEKEQVVSSIHNAENSSSMVYQIKSKFLFHLVNQCHSPKYCPKCHNSYIILWCIF